MPLNELESHPYLDYLNDNLVKGKEYKGLIIGSFPIYGCTNSLNPFDLENIIEERFDRDKVKMRFFYGSKKSKFWKYCAESLGCQDPTENENANEIVENIINFLNDNDLIITDIIKRTNRKNEGSEDVNLLKENGADVNIIQNFAMNKSIYDLLKKHRSIKNLYFTAKDNNPSPYRWFKGTFNDIFEFHDVQGYENSRICNFINSEREFNIFLLPTPKPRGVHYSPPKSIHPYFDNFLNRVDPILRNSVRNLKTEEWTNQQKNLVSEYRKQFIIETYKMAFQENNLYYNGE